MGEFGFITADGVYHVTVYATDENGNFKIISMKNIRVKPYPTAANAKDTRTGHSLSLAPQSSAAKTPAAPFQKTESYTQSSKTTPLQQTKKPINPILEPVRACSHCSLPTTTTAKPIYPAIDVGVNTLNKDKDFGSPGTSNKFEPNNAIVGMTNFNSNSKINSNFNTGAVRPQSNNIYGDNTPNLSDGANLIPNNLQLPLDTNSQSYEPFDLSGINQQNRLDFRNQNNYQDTKASNVSQPSQGGNPQQFNPSQSSAIGDTIGFGRSQPSQERNPLQYNPNQPSEFGNIIRSSSSQPSQGSNAQQNNPTQPTGINNSRQQFGTGPSPDYVSTVGNNQNYPQNKVDNSALDYSSDDKGERNPKQLNRFGQHQTGVGQSEGGDFGTPGIGKPDKPVLISAQIQIVDKSTDVYYKKPGEKDGLPNGLAKGDMENLLYTFNYTLAFHGHYEEGYSSGAKQGYYFVTGRNGVRTRIDYVADENGFRPKITQEVLDLISEDVPKAETEKDEKYGLKGYEFKWLYFPVGSKQS